MFGSIALYPRCVSLFLVGGQKLPDPKKFLRGGGSTMRHVVLDDVSITTPAVKKLIRAAIRASRVELPKSGGRIIIKSICRRPKARRLM